MIETWSVCVARPDGRPQATIAEGWPGLAVTRREGVTVLLSGELLEGGGAEEAAAAYLRWGDDCAEHLRGAYALVVIDERTGSVLCVRDRAGAHPLFHAVRDGILAVAPALDPLIAHAGTAPDRFTCAAHLLGRPGGAQDTFFAGIRRLPAGHLLVDQGRGPVVSRYWSPPPAGTLELRFAEAAERFGALLGDAVTRASGPDSAAASVLLSGGMDSGVVGASLAAVAAGAGATPPLAMSLSLAGTAADETAAQRRVAAGLGLPHLLLGVHEAVAPLGLVEASLATAPETAAPPGLLMAPYDALMGAGASRGVRVALNGEGGDEWLMPTAGFAVDHVRRADARAVYAFVRAWSRYWPGASMPGVARAVARGTAQDAARRLRPQRMRARRRAALLAGMPPWLLAGPADRAALADLLLSPEPALAEHPSISIVHEEAFATRRRTGVSIAMPLLDADVVAFLAALEPSVLLHGGQAKSLALDVIERRLPGARPWPRTVFGGDLWRTAIAREHEGVMTRLRQARAVVDGGIVAPDMAKQLESGTNLSKAHDAARIYDLVAIANWLDGRTIAP